MVQGESSREGIESPENTRTVIPGNCDIYEIDKDKCYTMPTCGAFRDPRPWESGGMRYGKITSVSISFLTERSAAERCLPKPFEIAEEPIVSITLQQCKDVDWLAGHGYNLMGVDLAAIFNGQEDRNVTGTFCVVMWEDMCEPIIGGRDHSGVPKIFADIDAEHVPGQTARCTVSRFDHTFLEFEAHDLKEKDADARAEIERVRRDHIWMNLKHFPKLENDGADVSYATVYPSSGQCVAAWSGQGSITMRTATPRQAPTQHDVINLLAGLPIVEVRSASVMHWKEVRAIDRKPYRLL